MLFEIFQLGPFHVYSYGLMIAIGILAAYSVAEKRIKARGMETKRLEWLLFTILGGGFLGSKLLYIITRFGDIASDPSILWDLQEGWVVYGGILGGIAAGYIYCRLHDMNFWQWFDQIIPCVALAQGFGRIGCFLAGCCYGVETNAWYGVEFPENSLAPSGVSLVPIQLVMAAFDFLLFFLLSRIAKKETAPGQSAGWYLILYSAGRFAAEYFRGDLIRGGAGGFSTSQIIAVFTLIAGICILIWGRSVQKKQTEKKETAGAENQ